MKLELCIGSWPEAVTAREEYLDRMEVCSALEVGGLTPSVGLIEACLALEGPEVHVMLRPRPGGFQYTSAELKIMERDLDQAIALGVDGVVFGILTPASTVDPAPNARLLDRARSAGLESTFHRAFDLLDRPAEGLEQLIGLGFDRVLTSGRQPLAIQGLSHLKELVARASGRIQIMGGSGVNGANAALLAATGADALHFSARKRAADRSGLGMGADPIPDPLKIRAIRKALAG